MFYVQALSSPLKTDVYYNDNVSTKNNGSMNNTIVQMPVPIMRKGPYTSTFKIKTKDSTFNNVTYSPKQLIVQQVTKLKRRNMNESVKYFKWAGSSLPQNCQNRFHECYILRELYLLNALYYSIKKYCFRPLLSHF